MKSFRSIKIGLLITLLVFFLVSCIPDFLTPPLNDDETSTENVTTVSYGEEFRGDWIRLDNNEYWEIRSKSIRVNIVPYLSAVRLGKISDNIISVTEGNEKFYLYSLHKTDTSVRGKIVDSSTGAPLSGVTVSVSEMEENSTTTNSDGVFELKGLVKGKRYPLSASNGVSFDFVADYNNEDIGIIRVGKDASFKASILHTLNNMFSKYQYDFDLTIKNIGKSSSDVFFQIAADDGLNLTVLGDPGSESNYLSFSPGESKSIRVRVVCDDFEEESVTKRINIKAVDRNRRDWNDYVELLFYRDSVELEIAAEENRSVNCLWMGGETTKLLTGVGKTTISIPSSAVNDGCLVMYSSDSDSLYSLGFDSPSFSRDSLLDKINETEDGINIYEPDDKDTSSHYISRNETLVSYLDKKDVDVFKLELSHNFTSSVTTNPTCTESGSIADTCSICGKNVVREILSALGHEDNGRGVCSRCGVCLYFSVTPEGVLQRLPEVVFPENVVIPEEIDGVRVTSIGDSCFSSQSTIKSIAIPSTVTAIGNNAFNGCTSLESINIPDSITTIGDYVFYYCSSLPSVVVPVSVTEIGDSTFSGCSSLEEITLPFVGKNRSSEGRDGVFGYIFGSTSYQGGTSVDQYIDSGSSVTRYIPSSLVKVTITDAGAIPYGAFSSCSMLQEIVLNDTITSIGAKAFYNCYNLSGEFDMPLSVTTIGDDAFYNCSKLTKVELPSEMTEIATGAFYGCTSLRGEFVLPSSLSSIGEYAFYNCGNITSIDIPSGVETIGSFAFTGWNNEQNITLNCPLSAIMSENGSYSQSNAGYLSNYVFDMSYVRVTLNLSSATTRIPSYAFYGWNNLVSVIVPPSVSRIESYAFYNCANLQRAVYDSSSTQLGYCSFPDDLVTENITLNSPLIEEKGRSLDEENNRLIAITADSDCLIYYTTDGTLPSSSSTLYVPQEYENYENETVSVVKVPSSSTVKAVAYKDDVYSAVSTKDSPAPNVTATFLGYKTAEIVLLQLSVSSDASIYYTTDGTEPTTDSILYSPLYQNDINGNNVYAIALPINTEIKFRSYGNGIYSDIGSYTTPDKNNSVSFDTNGQWSTYSGSGLSSDEYYSYYSTSNYGINSSTAIMYINIEGYDTFTIYIRSYAEDACDYTRAYEVDSTSVKETTSGFQRSDGSILNNYKMVTYTGLGGGRHRIRIDYYKDYSVSNYDDRGYLVVPKNQ